MILVTKENVYINCYNICTVGEVKEKEHAIAINGQLILFETKDEKEWVLSQVQQYMKTYGSANEGVRYQSED